MIKNFDQLMATAKTGKKGRLIVAAAQDEDVLKAVCEAAKLELVEPILVGKKSEIESIASKLGLDLGNIRIVDVEDVVESARVAVKMVRDGEGDFLMKGIIQTADIMRAVLDKEIGLRTENLISHVIVYEVSTYNKLLFITDGGMNIAPDLNQKVQILENALKVTKAMGIERTYVSAIAGAEVVNPKVPALVDAKALSDMKEKWESLNAAVIGPVALDLAISEEACKHKKYTGEGAGNADILLVPYYEVGNAFGKSLTYFANGKSAGIIMGAKVPIVLVSRADTAETKLNSIALGSVISKN